MSSLFLIFYKLHNTVTVFIFQQLKSAFCWIEIVNPSWTALVKFIELAIEEYSMSLPLKSLKFLKRGPVRFVPFG